MKNATLLIFFLFSTLAVYAQNAPIVIPLWENGAPGFADRKNEAEEAKDYWVKNIHNPSITVFPAENPNGSAVLIFPGGGHRLLVFDAEGTKTAKYLNTLGVTGIVIKYRLFREEGSPYNIQHAKEDGVRAMRLIRAHAKDWHIKEDRIGIMGFSAGGEVVNMIAYEDFPGNAKASDVVEQQAAKANFQVQIYPGPLGIPETVSQDAIPAFLLASNHDECCSATVVDLLNAYRKAQAPVEMHFYDKGAHGFNMGERSEYQTISKWPARLAEWLEDYHFFAD